MEEIFKLMKSKDLQPGLLYPAKLFQNRGTDKELSRQEKAKGVHHHQTNIIRNVKGSSLKRRQKIKTMNTNGAINTIYQQLSLKNKINEKNQKQTQRYREQIDALPDGRRVRQLGEKGEGIKKYKLVVTE